jgi:hypothetical protein
LTGARKIRYARLTAATLTGHAGLGRRLVPDIRFASAAEAATKPAATAMNVKSANVFRA